MRRALIPASVVVALIAAAWPATTAGDEAAVRRALEHYLAGHATGEAAHMEQAFHTEARLFWVQDGELRERTSAAYIAGFNGRPAADEAQRRRWIESIDIAGTAASGKIVLEYPNGRFVDYMSLLKVDGEWKIVNKIFHREPR